MNASTRPRVGRPIAADGDATRARILAEARRAFADLGYAATTYRLLAERAALSPSALYNYFGSKAELYAAVHDAVKLETYAEWILPAIAGTQTFASRLDSILGVFIRMNAEVPEASRFLASARIDTARHDELAPIRDALPAQRRDLFAEMVDLGVSTGEIDPADRGALLAVLETMTVGLIEVSTDPEQHQAAVHGFGRAIAALLSTHRG